MKQILFAFLLPGASEHLIGDLEEEARSHSPFWLVSPSFAVGALAIMEPLYLQ